MPPRRDDEVARADEPWSSSPIREALGAIYPAWGPGVKAAT